MCCERSLLVGNFWDTPRLGLLLLVSVYCCCCGVPARLTAQEPSAGDVLVTVNGNAVTRHAVELAALARGLPIREKQLPRELVDGLIDQALIGEFLEQQQVNADPRAVDAALERIGKALEASGESLKTTLAKLNLTEEALRRQLALPLAWQVWLRKSVSADELKAYFAGHRAELDGTRVRAAQILLRADDADSRRKALEQLQSLREEIAAGKLPFATAVARYSQAPSRRADGDLGFFPYEGKMPVEFTQHVFALKPGELSQPFETRFGVHLCRVTDRIAGTLTLEDVRSTAWARLSRERWTTRARKLRETAEIRWNIDPAELEP